MSSILDRFHPLIAQWFAARFGQPTDVQVRAWRDISEGKHVLVTAPTGSGKTLAAFLWAINQLVNGAWPRGETRVLYVSPLKALNNDVQRNLLLPLRELETVFRSAGEAFPVLNVQTRSGDTPGSERQRMVRRPPEILITTPESLNILLTSASGRQMLTGIATVIFDEIHAVVGSKRGTHLITAVDRLVPLCGEFQRIALSATVKPLELVADFVGGFIQRGDHYEKRPVTNIRADQAKEFQLRVCAPEEAGGDADEFWPRLAGEFRQIIASHRSTLFFANSRRTTERVTRLINEEEGGELAYAHHGSLSKEIRLAVEEKLKKGELKAIVATNSLELGIDIGRLDNVVLIQTPRSISSAIQRIGRSGHRVGEVSRGLLYPSHGMDFVAAAVMARAISERDLEPIRPVECPLDLLAQIILSMAHSEEWDMDELYAFLRTSYPYRNLQRRHFDLVIRMLEGRYADSHVPELRPRLSIDRVANTIAAREGIATLIYLEGGTIPDRGYFDLRLKDTGAKIGELDEEFVWERRLGETFALGAQVWQISDITHNAVEVVPARRPQQIIPFWRGEELDRDFHYSEKIAVFLERCEGKLAQASFSTELEQDYALQPAAAVALAEFLRRQREATGSPLPHRHHLLIEHYRDPQGGDETGQVILHTLWGNGLNRPFTFALMAAWEKQFGYPLEAFYNNDALALLLPHDFHIDQLLALVNPENLEPLLRESLERTGYFGARFRENAGRSLLLPKTSFRKRMPLWLTRLRSKKLLGAVSRYGDFPVLLETWRSCLQDDFDLDTLKRLLAELQEGVIRVSETRSTTASPFAAGLIWQQTNKYVYEDDTPSGGVSALGQNLIRELAVSPHLRPRIPQELIRLFEEKRQRLASGYPPDSGRDLVDFVKERLLLPDDEWSRLLDVMEQEHGLDRSPLLEEVALRLVRILVPGAAAPLIAAIDLLPEVISGLGRERSSVQFCPLLDHPGGEEAVRGAVQRIFAAQPREAGGDDGAAGDVVAAACRVLGVWLSFYGPMPLSSVEQTLAMSGNLFTEAISALEESGQLIIDPISDGATTPEVCDAANLETLLRILRRSRRPAFEALPIRYLPLFLASFQGLTQPGQSLDDLRLVLEQLFGYPAAAAAWEEEVLPARMQHYSTAWLDSLMQTSDLSWFGCGQGKLSFAFPEDIPLFREPEWEETGQHEVMQRLFPDRKGRYSSESIRAFTGLPADRISHELWQLAWEGKVSNDSFEPVRKGILSHFGERQPHKPRLLRHQGSRWNVGDRTGGSWYLPKAIDRVEDPIEREERNKDRARVLLQRYGILFRQLIQRELPPMLWPQLFRTLRIMELSGEVICGSFFTGIPGLQFLSHEAHRMVSQGLAEDVIYWLEATDPASLCGIGLEGLKEELPSRIGGTHLVYHGTKLVLISRRFGKELHFITAPASPQLQEYLAFFNILLTREFNPPKRIEVDRINAESAQASPYRQALTQFGFQVSYKGLELWRRY